MKNRYNSIKTSYIDSINIENLKGVKKMQMSFSKGLTCIIGENGVGKTTILHALSCVYTNKNKSGYAFSSFFTPYSGQNWDNSVFEVSYSVTHFDHKNEEITIKYKKTPRRWLPRSEGKLKRNTIYIGLSTCVPAIEQESQRSVIKLKKLNDNVKNGSDILKYVNDIMGKSYSKLFKYNKDKKEYWGITQKSTNEDISQSYSSLSMSAGEQRCIQILEEVLAAPENSLILIEEIDILLHQKALIRLINILNNIAQKKQHQIVFSCHNPAIRKAKNVAFRCLQSNNNESTVCFDGFIQYDLFSLTGERFIKARLYVEDMLAKALLDKLLENLDILSQIQVEIFGASSNAFSLVTGLYMTKEYKDQIYYAILDGDVFMEKEERMKRMEVVYTGSKCKEERKNILEHILNFNIPKNEKPEKYIKRILMEEPSLSSNFIVRELANTGELCDHHEEILSIFDRLNMPIEVGYSKIADLFSRTTAFKDFMEPIYQKLLYHNIVSN